MTKTSSVKRKLLIAMFVALLAGNSLVLYLSLLELFGASNAVRDSMDVRHLLHDVMLDVANAETGQRGFLLTSNEMYLEPYRSASTSVQTRIVALNLRVQGNPAQVARVAKIRKLIDDKFGSMAQTILLNETKGNAAAIDLVRQNHGKSIMDDIRAVVGEMEQAEREILAKRDKVYSALRWYSLVSLVTFIVETLVLIGLLAFYARREIRHRSEAAERISAYAADLDSNMKDLTQERNEVAQLNEVSNFLQSCNSFDEISDLIGPFMLRLFPGYAGSLQLFAASRNQLNLVSHWGMVTPGEFSTPQHCWALRRGQTHSRTADSAIPLCGHFNERHRQDDTVCIPLIAHGETIGLFSLLRMSPTESRQAALPCVARFAEMVTRQLGLTLANIQLRESLNDQSIRDPMTGAFNRRYLDVVAEKEISKAKRFERPMVVAMLDVDHFKRFNDMHGHQAGDAALIAVSAYLCKNLREGDWLFRYGGEEFLILLTETGDGEAFVKLEQLREGIAVLSLHHGTQALPCVTVSIGFALFPRQASEFADLVKLADTALYSAKKSGRNCVIPTS